MLTGISGSKTWRNCAHTASGSGEPSASAPPLTDWSFTVSPMASASLPSRRYRPVSVWTV